MLPTTKSKQAVRWTGRSNSTSMGVMSQRLIRLIADLIADPSLHLPRQANGAMQTEAIEG